MNKQTQKTVVILLLLVLAVGVSLIRHNPRQALAQARLSPTPIRVQIATATPGFAIEQPVLIPTFTPLPTQPQAAFLRVPVNAEGGVNVRAEADPGAALLGVIQPGDEYVVTGQYFMWYRFRYENAPGGQGWVFGQLVEVFGDLSLIPDLSQEPQATTDATVIGATQTWEVLVLTPGGDLTATANARELIDPVSLDRAFSGDGGSVSGLPTFTPPPNIALATLPPAIAPANQASTGTDVGNGVASGGLRTNTGDSIPPLMPIAILVGLGVLGLIVSSLRR